MGRNKKTPEEPQQPKIKAVEPTVTETTKAIPIIKHVLPVASSDNVWLVYKPTGNKIWMARAHAENMANNNPTNYAIEK